MRSLSPSGVLFALVASAATARAAGGHFDVDDAHIVDPGHCQIETWWMQFTRPTSTVLHLGPACRLGRVELGLNLDRLESGGRRRGFIGPQAKIVADPLIDGLSVGLSYGVSYDARHGGKPVQSVNLPVTWAVGRSVEIHLNAGLDRAPVVGGTRRLGASGEWAASERWTVIAERITFSRTWTSRVGARLALGASTGIDMSVASLRSSAAASTLSSASTRSLAIGLNHDLER